MAAKKKKSSILPPLLRHYAPAYLIGLAALFAVDYIALYIPQFMGDVTDGLASHTLDGHGIFLLCVQIVMCGLVVFLGRLIWRWGIFGSARKIERKLRNRLFSHLEILPRRYFHEHKTGDLMSYFTNDLEAVRIAIGPAIVTCFDATALTVMVLYRMITHVSVKLTLYTLIPMGVLAVFGYFYGELIEKRYRANQKAFATLSDYVQESISGERVIKAFVQEEKQGEAFREVNDAKRRASLRVVRLWAAFGPFLRLLVGVTYVVAIVLGGWYTMIGDMTLGRFVAFNAYIGSLVWPMLALGDSITNISQGIAGMNRLHEILDETTEIADDPEPDDVKELTGAIEIEDMSFRYLPGLPDKLTHINLKVAPGETLAVMGRTGSGKSTLVDLLCRLYDVSEGAIRFDGHDVRKIPLHVLRENIAYVPQDNFLFSNTLAVNIAFGKLDASHEEI